jgi:hypothetical protein
MLFGDFVQKYNIEAAVPTIAIFIDTVGDMFTETTAYIMSEVGAVVLNATANGGLLVPTTFNNSELYAHIAQQLGSDVLYSSTICSAQRNDNTVSLVVNSPDGQKTVNAKKLLVTAPPLRDVLRPLDLDNVEEAIFARLKYNAVYVAVLANTGLPDGLEIYNNVPTSSPYVLNQPGTNGQPFVSEFIFTGVPGLYRTTVIGGPRLTADAATALIAEAAMKVANTTHPPQMLAFTSHNPLEMRPDPPGIRSGFYREAFGLSGRHGTYYSGAAWATDYTSVQWLFLEETILPMILKSLQ